MTQHPERPERFVLRILSQNGSTVGAGFVISEHLAVTCAHVVIAARNEGCVMHGKQDVAGKQVTVEFYYERTRRSAKILYAGWSPPNGDDVAFIWLENLPDGIIPATLGTAENRSGHPYTALAFPLLFDREARFAHDYIGGVVPVTGRRAMLQIEGKKVCFKEVYIEKLGCQVRIDVVEAGCRVGKPETDGKRGNALSSGG